MRTLPPGPPVSMLSGTEYGFGNGFGNVGPRFGGRSRVPVYGMVTGDSCSKARQRQVAYCVATFSRLACCGCICHRRSFNVLVWLQH